MNTKLNLELFDIKSPCSVGWETMEGNDRTRFCQKCNLYVTNLSDMSSKNAEKFISKIEGRQCVYFRRKPNGVIIRDGCPVFLRGTRRMIRLQAISALVAISATFSLFLSAGQLQNEQVTATFPPSDLCSNAVAYLFPRRIYASSVFNTLGWLLTLTTIALIPVLYVPFSERSRKDIRLMIFELTATTAIPILIYLAGIQSMIRDESFTGFN